MVLVSSDLARAIFANDPRAVARAVHASDPPSTHVAQGVPAIVYAAFLQRPAALDALLGECAKHIDVNATYEHQPFAGWRAFHFATVDRDAASAAQLDAAGCDTTPAPNELLGSSWLDIMEGLGNNEFTSYVSACKAAEDPAAFLSWHDPAGRTALHVAAIIGSGPLVHLLFELGLLQGVAPADMVGDTPLTLAIQHGLPSMGCIQALIDHGAKPTQEHVLSAASRGLSRLIALLVGSGAPVPPGVSRRAVKNAVGAAGGAQRPRTPGYGGPRPPTAKPRACSTTESSMLGSDVLMNEAVARDNLEAFKVLLATGAHDASQLLARVAACGSVRMLEMLLAVPGVDPNARLRAPGCAFDGGTALHCAVASYETREEHVRVLVEAGADVNAALPCGLAAMDVANDARTRALLASHGGRHAPYETTVARSIFRTTQER